MSWEVERESRGMRAPVEEEEDLEKSWEREWRASVSIRIPMCGMYRTDL